MNEFEKEILKAVNGDDIKAAVAIVKAINRRVRRHGFFDGGKAFGVDYNTWVAVYPQMAFEYNKAAEVIQGKPGRYLPRF